MARRDNVVSYLTKFTQIRDEKAAIGEVVHEIEMVRIARMASPSSGACLFEYWHGRNFPTGKGYGTTSFRRSCELGPHMQANQRLKRSRIFP
jgi:hypothetical protein